MLVINIFFFSGDGFSFFRVINPFPNDNFKLDENGRKSSKPVENTVGKGEIARYEQFLLFPQCFKDLYYRHVQQGLVQEKVKRRYGMVKLWYGMSIQWTAVREE